MAFIHMNLISTALMRTVPVNVIIPADKRIFRVFRKERTNHTKHFICCMEFWEAMWTG